MSSQNYTLNSLTDTEKLGRKIAPFLRPRDIIFLKGDLGAGKTALARSIITSLNPYISHVPSPTFTLVQTYETSRGQVWHFDLYRIHDREEVFELGIEEALASGISLVEWPERLGKLKLSSSLLEINLGIVSHSEVRQAELKLFGNWNQRWKT